MKSTAAYAFIAAELLMLSLNLSGECPSTCECSTHQTGYLVDCIEANKDELNSLKTLTLPVLHLRMKFSYLPVIDQSYFDLPSLTDLNLDYSNITNIENHGFIGVKSVQRLSIRFNNLYNISNYAFANLSKLNVLDLSNNYLSCIQQGLLQDLISLSYLNLSNNSIGSISCDVFAGLHRLTNLNLSNNNLTSICPKLFKDISELTILHLDSNSLQLLPSTFLGNNKNLRTLHLEKNFISQLPKRWFNRSIGSEKAIQNLYLNCNNLSMLMNDTFIDLASLVVLDLSNNSISVLEPGVLGLKNLKEIYLSYMPNFLQIKAFSFSAMVHLEVLSVHSNPKLFVIEKDSLYGLAKLQYVDLHANNLCSLHATTISNWSALTYLDLSNNPWNCNCTLKYLRNVLMYQLENNFSENILNNVRCASPDTLGKIPLLELPPDVFVCSQTPGVEASAVKQSVITGIIVGFASILLVCIVIIAVKNRRRTDLQKRNQPTARQRRLRRRLEILNQEYSNDKLNSCKSSQSRLIQAAAQERMIPAQHAFMTQIQSSSHDSNLQCLSTSDDDLALPSRKVSFNNKVVVRTCIPISHSV